MVVALCAGDSAILQQLVSHLPAKSGAAYLVACDDGPDLAASLRAVASAPVIELNERHPLEADHYYVIPAAHDLAVPAKGGVVLVVRDLHRHPEQADLIGAMLRKRPDAVLVEMGLPMCRLSEARNYIATYGSARVCAQAAAEVMHR
jgi:chemotaxis response regulator CheB